MTAPADRAIFCLLCDLIAVTDVETPIDDERRAATQRLRSIREVFVAGLTDKPSQPPLDPSDPNADCQPGVGQ